MSGVPVRGEEAELEHAGGSDGRLTELHHPHHQTSMQPQADLPLLSNGALRTRGLCTWRAGLGSVTSCDATETRRNACYPQAGGRSLSARLSSPDG